MSEHAHTPGPWIFVLDDMEYDVLGYVENEDSFVLAEVPATREDGDNAEGQANGMLFAAAPDMLKALKSALARLDNGYRLSLEEQRAAAERLHAAIAKATGATP